MSSIEIDKLQKKWTLIIRPQRAWWDLQLGEIWRYRDLILLFVWRDFVAYYKQTILGPLWYLIQPILTTVVFTVIFGNIAKLPTDGLLLSCFTWLATQFGCIFLLVLPVLPIPLLEMRPSLVKCIFPA